MAEPHGPQHRVVALLRQEQLPAMPESHVRLAVLVHVWRVAIRATQPVQVKGSALADIDEEPNVSLAPEVAAMLVPNPNLYDVNPVNRWHLLSHVLLGSAYPSPATLPPKRRRRVLCRATDALTTEHVTT